MSYARDRDIVITKKFKYFVLICAAITLILSAIGLWLTSTSVRMSTVALPMIGFLLMLSLGYGYRHRDIIISEVCFVVALMVAITNMCNIPMFIIARFRPPFKDSALLALDRLLGVEVPAILSLENRFPKLFSVVCQSYEFLIPTLAISVIAPTAYGHGKCVREFFVALIVAAVIGFGLFYLFPAQGWFEHYGITPRPDQVFYLDTIRRAWTENTFVVDFSYRAGLVYFPSFHTILPLLGLFAVRAITPLMLVLSPVVFVIILSTLTTGSHYVCDIYAGVAVALLSQLIATRAEKYLT